MIKEPSTNGTAGDAFIDAIAERVADKLEHRLMQRLEPLLGSHEQPYLTISDAARLVSKSRKTIYDAIYSGDLDYLQHGNRYTIRRADLDAWMAKKK